MGFVVVMHKMRKQISESDIGSVVMTTPSDSQSAVPDGPINHQPIRTDR